MKELPEDTPIETVIASVKASHASSQPLYYSMVAPQDSRSQNLFTLDTVSCFSKSNYFIFLHSFPKVPNNSIFILDYTFILTNSWNEKVPEELEHKRNYL